MKSAITAIGTANPSFKRNQMELAEVSSASLGLTPDEKRLLVKLYRASGIDCRYSVLTDYVKNPGELEFYPNDPHAEFPTTAARMQLYKKNALTLALDAIKNSFASQDTLQPQDITHLIVVSCTGMYAPGLDIELVHALQLASHTKRTAIQFMGCYGTFNGLKVADAICQSDVNAKVLLVSVEICSIHFQKNKSLDSLIANAIFADGAGAAIIETVSSQKKQLQLSAFHCELIPQASQEMAWHIGDQGFDIVLSSYVPGVIQSGIAEFVERLLHQNKLTRDNIDFFAIHPGGMKILQACESALQISPEDNRHSYDVLKYFGNMSSATILFVLKKYWETISTETNGKKIFSCAFGPGLTLESMLLKIMS